MMRVARLGQVADQVAHVLDLGGVEPVGGLVQDQDGRLVEDGLRHPHALAVAAGQGGDGDSPLGGQLGALQGLADRRRPVLGPDPMERGLVIQVVDDGHLRVEGAVLRQIADAPLNGAAVGGDVQPVDADAARVRLKEAGEHLHDGGLARPVVAEQADDFAATDIERDIVHRAQIAITS